jgi:hypothetical protein
MIFILLTFIIIFCFVIFIGYTSLKETNKIYKAVETFKLPKWAKTKEPFLSSNNGWFCKFTSGIEGKGVYKEECYYITKNYKLGKKIGDIK